jgi:hypothetical protein
MVLKSFGEYNSFIFVRGGIIMHGMELEQKLCASRQICFLHFNKQLLLLKIIYSMYSGE